MYNMSDEKFSKQIKASVEFSEALQEPHKKAPMTFYGDECLLQICIGISFFWFY